MDEGKDLLGQVFEIPVEIFESGLAKIVGYDSSLQHPCNIRKPWDYLIKEYPNGKILLRAFKAEMLEWTKENG